jgi:alkylation response protein AidB-like acyl-CoA dehydrogenase
MDFRLTPQEEAFKEEIRSFFRNEKELAEKVRMEVELGAGQGLASKELMRKMGARGYLTPSWPKKYGGLEKSYVERYIVSEELAYSVGSLVIVGVSMVGPTLLLFGSEKQKETYLPRIAKSEIYFALGYTEPQDGSDLASLEMKAVKDGDYYILNGQKTFNTAPHFADYHWVAARTDPAQAKHRGISLFIVDMNAPGITIRPLIGLGKFRTNEVYYDNVRIHKDQMIGEENRAWKYLLAALSFERTWLVGDALHMFEELIAYLKEQKENGQMIDSATRREMARLSTELEITRLMGMKIACILNQGRVPDYEAAQAKYFGSETSYGLTDECMKVLSYYSQLDIGSHSARIGGKVNRWYFQATRDLLTRGTSEIMKNILAQRKLEMPR